MCPQVAMEDFVGALLDVKPAFGAVIDTLEMYRLNGIIDYGDSYRHLASTCHSLVAQARPLPTRGSAPQVRLTAESWRGLAPTYDCHDRHLYSPYEVNRRREAILVPQVHRSYALSTHHGLQKHGISLRRRLSHSDRRTSLINLGTDGVQSPRGSRA